MSTNAKEAKYRRQLAAVEAHKAELKKPADQQDKTKYLPAATCPHPAALPDLRPGAAPCTASSASAGSASANLRAMG